jgi:hypothetical protein
MVGAMKFLLAIGLCVAACGSKDGDDWTKRSTKAVSGTVEGIKFTIDLPDGMRQRDSNGQVEFDFLVGEYVKTPNITIGAGGFAKTLEEYIAFEKTTDNWIRKDKLPDGYITTAENSNYKGKEDYVVYLYKAVGDKVLTCNARVTPWSPGASVKDKLPLVEKICQSLKAAS